MFFSVLKFAETENMSVRAIWIINVSFPNFGKVYFFRKFPTVERRSRQLQGSSFVPVPSPEDFASGLLISLGLSQDSKHFIESRDAALLNVKLPTIEVKQGEKKLWPVVVIEQNSLLVCCLPHVENSKDEYNDLLQIPSVSVGFAVLMSILSFLGPSPTFKDELSPKFIELDNYISLSMPFGKPTDTEPENILAFYNCNEPLTSSVKQPAWKPVNHKGKSVVSIEVVENVRSSQCDEAGFHPVTDVYGTIYVKAEVEGRENDISISLSHSDPSKKLSLDSFIIHPCVQSYSPPAVKGTIYPRRLRFTPPLYRFALCSYRAPENKEPPIIGIFKMKGESSVELLLQLKLSENAKNAFDFCEATVPFFSRGPIQNFEFKLSHGFLNLSEDKHSLKWNLGSKFPPRTLEAVLTARIELSSGPLPSYNDPFCVGKNCYTQINFKLSNHTISGCYIDPKSVSVSSASKVKISSEHSTQSTEYKIWNSYGDLPFPVLSSDKLQVEQS